MRLFTLVVALAVACAVVSSTTARVPIEAESPIPSPPTSPWTLPLAFTAWGFQDGTLTAHDLARRLVGAGIRSIAIQITRDGPRASRMEAEIFDRAGLDVYLWGIPNDGDHGAALTAYAGIVDGYIAQVEDDQQYEALLDALAAGVGEHLPRAVVTTFEGINTTRNGLVRTPERLQPLLAAGITTVFVECYRQDHPSHGDLELMTWQARQYGWSEVVPVIGLFRGARLRDYESGDIVTDGWGFWNAEQIHPDDWSVLKAASRRWSRGLSPPSGGRTRHGR